MQLPISQAMKLRCVSEGRCIFIFPRSALFFFSWLHLFCMAHRVGSSRPSEARSASLKVNSSSTKSASGGTICSAQGDTYDDVVPGSARFRNLQKRQRHLESPGP